MQYIVEILKIITWPLLTFWVIFYFRIKIAGFIDRVYQLKFPGGEVNAKQKEALVKGDCGKFSSSRY